MIKPNSFIIMGLLLPFLSQEHTYTIASIWGRCLGERAFFTGLGLIASKRKCIAHVLHDMIIDCLNTLTITNNHQLGSRLSLYICIPFTHTCLIISNQCWCATLQPFQQNQCAKSKTVLADRLMDMESTFKKIHRV